MSTSLSDYMNDEETVECPMDSRSDHISTHCIWCVVEKLIEDIPSLIEAALDDLVDDLVVDVSR